MCDSPDSLHADGNHNKIPLKVSLDTFESNGISVYCSKLAAESKVSCPPGFSSQLHPEDDDQDEDEAWNGFQKSVWNRSVQK